MISLPWAGNGPKMTLKYFFKIITKRRARQNASQPGVYCEPDAPLD